MLPLDIGKKSIHDWTEDDLKNIVGLEAQESATLELKEDLPTPDGASGWRKIGKIHRSERDGIAKEIVALANAYGGHVIIGIRESEDTPKRADGLAKPLPNLTDLVDRLGTALFDSIDPPLRGLDIAGIPAIDQDGGYVVIFVPSSVSSPHGVGHPPQSYIRRQDKSEPMTMRDMQSVFWEARSRRERIEAEIAIRQQQLSEFRVSGDCLAFRFTAISENEMAMPNLFRDLRDGLIFPPSGSPVMTSAVGAGEWPFTIQGWRPEPTGIRFEYGADYAGQPRRGNWEIDDTGTINVLGEIEGHERKPEDDDPEILGVEVFPGWFSKTAGHVIEFADKIGIYAGVPEMTWIFSGEFLSSNPNIYVVVGGRFDKNQFYCDFTKLRSFRPIPVANTNEVETLDFIERRIWECFGISKPDDQKIISSMFAEETVGS